MPRFASYVCRRHRRTGRAGWGRDSHAVSTVNQTLDAIAGLPCGPGIGWMPLEHSARNMPGATDTTRTRRGPDGSGWKQVALRNRGPSASHVPVRCYLKGELRRRWEIAWFMVPNGARDRLKPYLRSIRAVHSIRGTRLRLYDGTRATFVEEGEAVLASDETVTPPRGWLLIRKHAARVQEIAVVAMFLHELAHALYRIEDGPRAMLLPEAQTEAAAWLLAASWAAHGALFYRGGLDVVCYAMNRADDELGQWAELSVRNLPLSLRPAPR